MFSSFCISDDLSHKFVDYDAHHSYIVSFHEGKWIDSASGSFNCVSYICLATTNLRTLVFYLIFE